MPSRRDMRFVMPYHAVSLSLTGYCTQDTLGKYNLSKKELDDLVRSMSDV